MEQAGADSANLEGGEQEQAAQHAPLRAVVIHEIIRHQGEEELKREPGALFLSAFSAGLSMGLSFLAVALLRAGLPDEPWRHLVTSFGYTIGFVVVVLGRQQLFTENTLTAVLPVLATRDLGALAAMLRLWVVVLAGNLIGTWVFALAVSWRELFEPQVVEALGQVAEESVGRGFLPTLATGVFAGWLIALMVWLLPSSRSARMWVIMLMTWLVSLGRFSHIIAGSSEAAYAVINGATSVGEYFAGFLVPTLLGNILGGVSLVALLNHAPISDEVTD